MRLRRRGALFQLAAFVGGGLLAPLAHVATHRADHGHGPDGHPAADELRSAESGFVTVRPGGARPTRTRPPAHLVQAAHPHSHAGDPATVHSHAHAQAPEPATGGATPGEPASRAASGSGTSGASRRPAPLDHGRGSVSHFGLALLGAPPSIPLPKPILAHDVLQAPRTSALGLLQPSFPLPRPPPGHLLA